MSEITPPPTAITAADAILADPDVVWFPVKHYSPVCAWHLRNLILELKPAAVLVEAPDDATELIPHIVADDSRAPLAILSTWVDKKNVHELNGVLSASPDVPARFRGWWPLAPFSPEWVALQAGHEVGADLRFIDAPLRAMIPYDHVPRRRHTRVVSDRKIAQSAYLRTLARKQRRRSFDELWQAHFEAQGFSLDAEAFMRIVLTFAWCTRHVTHGGEVAGDVDGEDARARLDAAYEADGTSMRERHMRWHVEKALADHAHRIDGKGASQETDDAPEGHGTARRAPSIIVVTGAFHSVALPDIEAKRAPVRAGRHTETVVTAHSFPALAKLYDMSRLPRHSQVIWEALRETSDERGADGHDDRAGRDAHDERAVQNGLDGSESPFDRAALRLLVDIMRTARDEERAPVSTADVVGAYQAAKNLAALRGNGAITLDDLLDAVQMAFVKGEMGSADAARIETVTRRVLTGDRAGRVSEKAGQVPIMRDFYAETRSLRINTTGAAKTVTCDLHRSERHRRKSAFLHRCDALDIPMFTRLDNKRGPRSHLAGPDPVTGEDMHLVQERWAVQWTEAVDARLIDLSQRGATIEEAAESELLEAFEDARDHVDAASRLLLRCAQMRLDGLFETALERVEGAIATDGRFTRQVGALANFFVLFGLGEALPPRNDAIQAALDHAFVDIYTRACLQLPALANSEDEQLQDNVEALQTLVRFALTSAFSHGGATPGAEPEPLDRQLLVRRLRELVHDTDGHPTIRGAGFGVLFGLGATRDLTIARELESYLLGAPERVLQAGRFFDGVCRTARHVLVGRSRLLAAIHRVLAQLDWETFKRILPDLRRAFTQFIPSELDAISSRVGEHLRLKASAEQGGAESVGDEAERLVEQLAATDRRAATVLVRWLGV